MSRAIVVPAAAAQAETLAHLHAECFEDSWDAAAMRGLLETPGIACLIAGGEDRAPQGFVLARAAADEAEILSIGVVPAARGSGLGQTLLDAILIELRLIGVAAVFLEVAQSNAAARALYLRAGFQPAGLRKGYYLRPGQPAEDALIFRLALAAP